MSWVFSRTNKTFLKFSRSYRFQIPTRLSSNFKDADPKTTSEDALSKISPTRLTLLDNGLRVVTENTGIPTATVGLWIDVGSRSEIKENNGIGHFIEHMMFKGTHKRSQTDLELEVRNLGAQLQGQTSREQTVYSFKCISNDVPRAVEILSDIIQNSKFEEADIENVKGTILHDMEDDEKNVKDLILDNLYSVAYQGTSLGFTVNGPTENIKNFKRENLLTFTELYYQPGNMVLVGSGGIDHDDLVKLAEDHFKGMKNKFTDVNGAQVACRYTGSDVRIIDYTMPLCHIAIAQEGVGVNDPNYIPLMLAKYIIGSWDRTHGAGEFNASALARISHKYKLCHAFESFYHAHKDTGLWGAYFISETASVDDFIFSLISEWKRICTNATDFEIQRAINSYRTDLLLQNQTTHGTSEDIGRQTLTSGRRVPVLELHEKIQAITADQVREAMYKNIYNNCPVVSSVGSMDQLFDYNRFRAEMYWLRL